MDNLQDALATVIKAIAGGLAAAAVSYLSRRGFLVDQNLSDAIVTVISALIGFAVVFIAPKNKVQ